MREFCVYADEFLSDIPSFLVDECGFMPDSCNCMDCPYYELRKSSAYAE